MMTETRVPELKEVAALAEVHVAAACTAAVRPALVIQAGVWTGV